jgi:hypothetical protein
MLDGEQQTIYDILTDVCSNSESQLVGLLNNQMEQYCLNLFENEKLSYPTVKLDINMVDLSQTTEYKDFQSLERIHLGDSVKVFNPRLGIESTVRVIGLTYDVLRKMNTEIQIGVTETSIINLLNNIGKGSDEVRYVAGDGITIENNTISVIPPTKPYLEDVLLNGESVVRNHKAYIDLDEMGIDETIDVLYGEEAPDDETDGEDKDFYLKEAGDVIYGDDYTAHSTEEHPITLDSFETIDRNVFNFAISGKPWNDGEGEELTFPIHNLVVGETYTLSCDMQFSGDITWFSPETTRDLIRIGDYRLDFQKNKNLNHYETEFVYSEGLSFEFLFYAIQDNKLFTATFTNFTIEGEMIGDKIIDIYNKRVGRWIKYTPPEMIGATSEVDGQSGIVPKPTISDKDKFLKGDGTWGEAGGGTEVSITPSLQSGTKIADYEIDGVTGELYAPRGFTTGLAWRSISEADYEDLSSDEKNNGTIYFVSDDIAELEGKTYIYISETEYGNLTTAEKNNNIPYFVYKD